MGIDPKSLNDKQVELIADPKQRKVVVKQRGFDTQAKIDRKIEINLERKMHDQYISFLRRHELPFVHANPVKPSTIKKGCPDFTVTGGEKYSYRSCYGEFKRPGQTLSEVQQEYIDYLVACGCKVYVWYDYESAIKDTTEFFELAMHRE
jgi:hypothetical protein